MNQSRPDSPLFTPSVSTSRHPAFRFAIAFLGSLLSAVAAEYYVAPNGSPSGTGQLQNPWNLQTALNHPSIVRPGDTIWLRGGTYPGKYRSVLRGAVNQPIIVRQYPGERAKIDANTNESTPAVLTADGNWTWFWGIEITNSNPTRRLGSSRPTGIDVFGPNIKIINMVVHDNGSGFGLWNGADDSEIYGTLIYYNGWEGGDRGHGHSIYSQNRLGLKRITDNIYFKSYSHGIHIYGSENAYLDNYLIEGNTGFDNGVLSPSAGAKTQFIIGGGKVSNNLVLRDNASFFSGSAGRNEIGYGAGCNNLVAERNFFVAPLAMKLSCTGVTLTGNLFYGTLNGMTAGQFPNNTYTTVQPTGLQVLIRPNRYERGRGHVTVYNWDNLSNVNVNLGSILTPGTAYEIRDAQNFYGPPVATGLYQGGSVTIPMTGTAVSQLVGVAEVALLHTPVRFGSFIVLPASGAVILPPANQPPSVTVGPAQTITLPATATVTGATSDDGQPNGTLTQSWSMSSGPGPVTFTNPSGLTTGVAFSSAGTYQLRLMASDGQLSTSATTQVTVNPAPTPPPTSSATIRVNTGGGRVTDTSGRVWEADRGFSGGSTFAVTRQIGGPSGMDPYQSVRYGNFTYRQPVANGTYRVTLRFAEVYHQRAGARVFSVNINGQPKLSSFDVFAAGGGFAPVDRQFDVSVSGGEIAIGFVSQIDYALINAIEIQPLTTVPAPAPTPAPAVSVSVTPATATVSAGSASQFSASVLNATNLAVTWTISPAVGSISASGLYQAPATVATSTVLTVTATSVADPTKRATAQITVQQTAPPPAAAFTPIRMNAGGPRYTDAAGNVWQSESNVSGGAVYSTAAAIANTTDQSLYKTVRYGTFRYQLPVTNGTRTVRLRFAENYYNQTGRRVFNVRINGIRVLTGFDIVAAGGAFAAVDREFPVAVTTGTVLIEFEPVVENPSIGAIEIR